jgi:hypothetical protein
MDMTEISRRLEMKFGLGTRPTLRKSLYDRLQGLVDAIGPEAYCIIATTAADAVGKTHPGRYFSKVVVLRLKEKGILETPEL